MATIYINDQEVEVAGERSILEAALEKGIYVPHLCYHPQLENHKSSLSLDKVFQGGVVREGPGGEAFEGCNLCLVEIQGREGLFQSCKTMVEDGLHVNTDSSEIRSARQKALASIIERHPHACLICPQGDGCDRKNCSSNVSEKERCCSLFGVCELQKVANFIGMEGMPPYLPLDIPILEEDALIKRDYNLCIGCMRCVSVCRDVKGADALGFILEDGRVVVGSKEPTLEASGCKFCGFCIEVCPTGALTDKDAGVGDRESYLIPCKNTCPAEIDVPAYIRYIKRGEFDKASGIIYERVPFPSVLGRVCFHPCEDKCRRGGLDESVAICALKRAAADHGKEFFAGLPGPIKPATGKKVGIIGSGPAGLTAAYYSNMLGHSATVFETLPEPGGMLRVGIPDFRLPRDVLDEEIRLIQAAGVEIKTDHPVDSVTDLLTAGFDAVFIALGDHKGVKLGISGEDHEGVIDGITFLRGVNLGRQVSIGEGVAVVGGGNVAIDSARCALRSGAKDVTVFYRRTREEMPAYDEEIEAALEEGVKIEFQVTPVGIGEADGALEVEFIRMSMGEMDESKRRRPVPIEGSGFKLILNNLIPAIGQQPEIPAEFGVSSSDGGRKMDMNPAEGVFCGGDLRTGPASVIDAIADGRKGAVLIDKFLGGQGDIDQVFVESKTDSLGSKLGPVNIDQGRGSTSKAQSGDDIPGFSEIDLGFDADVAVKESQRCLECDLRFLIAKVILPPEGWLAFDDKNVSEAPESEGVYLLYDEDKQVYKIAGVENLRQGLSDELQDGIEAVFFSYDEDPMYTSRETQLNQQYMKEHGELPPGNMDMDDLF